MPSDAAARSRQLQSRARRSNIAGVLWVQPGGISVTFSSKVLALGVVGAAVGFLQIGSAQAAGPAMVIQSDTVRGVQQGMTAPGCVLNNQFKPREEIVFRIQVIDTKTGKPMDKDTLKSLVIELPDGQKFPAHYGMHPPQDPIQYFWTFGWVIPANYPTGSFGYKVVATDKKGHTATFEPFKSKPSQLTVMADIS
jgi:hypothetical protein